MKKLKRLAAAVVSLTLAASMFGCTPTIGNGTQYASNIDGYEVKSGLFIYYTMQAYNEAKSMLSEQNSGEEFSVSDVKNSNIDGISASDWIQDKATEYCEGYITIQKEFDNAGLSLSQEELDEANEMAEYYYNMNDLYYNNGISEETMKELAQNSYKEQALFKYYYGFEGSKGGTEDELKDYFDENFARLKYLSISLTDDEGELLGEDEQRERRKMAENYVKQINSKKTDEEKFAEFDVVYDDYNEYLDSLNPDEDSEDEKNITIGTMDDPTKTDEDSQDTTESEENTEKTTENTTEEDSEDTTETTATVEDSEDTTETTATVEDSENTTETTATEEENEDSESVTTTSASDETDLSEETTTTTDPYANERLYQKQTTASQNDSDTTVTTTAETEDSKNSRNFSDYVFNNLELYNAELYDYDDKTIYVVIRGDLRERMTEDDYWSEDYTSQLLQLRYYDDFIDYMESVTDTLSTEEISASYRRYSPFKLELE